MDISMFSFLIFLLEKANMAARPEFSWRRTRKETTEGTLSHFGKFIWFKTSFKISSMASLSTKKNKTQPSSKTSGITACIKRNSSFL